MKWLFFVVASVLLIQASLADDGGVSNTKKCEDFLPADTCQKLRNLAQLLHEKATTVRDAVQDAIAHHKTKASEMLAYIKGYIAQRLQCDKVLPTDLCNKITTLGQRVKLTAIQIRLAIENAVAKGATTAQDIYNKTVDFMTTLITCKNIFGQGACDNMKEAVKKLSQQVQLLNKAIMAAAQKHFNTVKDMLIAVKNTIMDKALNFKCEDVLGDDTCTAIRELAKKLHLTAQQVKTAIKTAVINGAQTAKDIYNKAIEFLTTEINCVSILGQNACTNLEQARQKLGEQVNLIKEAIMAAVQKHITNVAAILKFVKDTLVEKATNFKCTDVLPANQCDFIVKVANRFKIRASELHKVLVEAVINGTKSAKEIYDKTIGALIEEAKDVKCEDLIPKQVCDRLDAFAKNIKLKVSDVLTGVKMAIAAGNDTVAGIIQSVRDLLVAERSCEDFLRITGRWVCPRIRKVAEFAGLTMKIVVEKMRSLYAQGVTRITDIISKIYKFIFSARDGQVVKRSLVSGYVDMLVKKIMELVEKAVTVGKDVQASMKAKIKELIESGKVKISQLRELVKDLIAKYKPTSDEDALTMVRRDVIDDLKAVLKKAHGKAKENIDKLLAKSKEQLEKLKEFVKQFLNKNTSADEALDSTQDIIEAMVYETIDDEMRDAEEQIEQMVDDELY